MQETKSTEESGDSSSADKSTEPARAETTSEKVPSEDQDNNIEPTVHAKSAHEADEMGALSRKRTAGEAFESDRERDLIRLAFEVDMARADFDVNDAKVQEMTESTSSEYSSLLLKRAQSHHGVVDAELKLKKAQLQGNRLGVPRAEDDQS
jgi:hypothetical protein